MAGDGSKPTCSRCKERGEQCSPSQILHYRSCYERFDDDQPWPDILVSRLRFIDETPDLAYYYDHDIESEYPESPQARLDTNQTEPAKSRLSGDRANYNSQAGSSPIPLPDNGKPQSANTHSTPYEKSSSPQSPVNSFFLSSQTKWNISAELPQSFWSDKQSRDVCLMRYFVEELAPWFDTCDVARHFALVVPHRAKSCPPLRYAIFSASARHLSRRQMINDSEVLFAGKKLPPLGEETALEYQSLCISHLMSLSGDVVEVQDENLLAAAVILRFYEEYDAPLAGIDDETYLRGTQVFLDAQSTAAMKTKGLRQAAFWVAFRQEFHRAFIKQRVFMFSSQSCASSPYRSLEPADDNTWTNRLVLHCTDVLSYCYAESSSFSQYDGLWEYNLSWQSLVPSTFNPLYIREPDLVKGEVFPELWYLDDCIGTNHSLPDLEPTIEPFQSPRYNIGTWRAFSWSLLTHVSLAWVHTGNWLSKREKLCGIAQSNKTAPALVMACMGATMCGDRVTSRLEQESVFDILVKLERVHALSTEKVQWQLKDAWANI